MVHFSERKGGPFYIGDTTIDSIKNFVLSDLMNFAELQEQVSLGEDSSRQFKEKVHNANSLAAEMVAFANGEGGMIFIGVQDNGAICGLSSQEVSDVNQLISNTASQHVRSPLTVQTKNVVLENSRVVIVLTIPKGIDKPYFDKNGVIWLKSGADKRRIHSKEELRCIFQSVDLLHADELPTKAKIDKIHKLHFPDFLWNAYKLEYPHSTEERLKLLQNMNLATVDGFLNVAGVLLFAERPEWIKPQFVVKGAVCPGNEMCGTQYLDTEDFNGPFLKIFEDAMAFIMRNLHKVQAGRGINAVGIPEVPRSVFEEVLVNALIHRDYFISAPIRLFVFENRIEIISPGNLPNHLTIEKIRTGNSCIRNPILASYAAKGLLPYKGLGSGVRSVIQDWSHTEFIDDRKGGLFVVRVPRKTKEELQAWKVD